MLHLLSIINQAQQAADAFPASSVPEWLAAAAIAYQTGIFTPKQKRKLKWKIAWEYVKSKLPFSKKRKETSKKTTLKIIVILLILGCFGFAIWLGVIKELLILVGAVILFFLLFMSAAKRN